MLVENRKITVDGNEMTVPKGMKLVEICKLLNEQGDDSEFICAKVNHKIKELNVVVNEGDIIELFDYKSHYGNKVYLAGLILVINYVCHLLYKDKNKMIVNHPVGKSLLFHSQLKMTKDDLKIFEDKIREIVASNLEIEKVTVLKEEAIEYFKKLGYEKKCKIIQFLPNSYVTLHKIGDMYSYMYERLPVRTGVLDKFTLSYVDDNEFALNFPTSFYNDEIPKFEYHEKFMTVFENEKKWCSLMGLESAVDLNDRVTNGTIDDIVRMSEKQMDGRLLDTAEIIKKDKKIKVILLSGPSSSGKTTTTYKLGTMLTSLGMTPKILSMDDYFVEREDTPKDEFGKYDFECFEAIDINLFNKTIKSLFDGKETILPTFDFYEGKKKFVDKMKMTDTDILLIEGIHALNPKLLNEIPRENIFKIYLSPLIGINIDHDNRFSTTDNRLLRRILRDSRTRGYSPETTIKNWYKVREGENKNVFAFQDEADQTINTSLVYEYNVLKTYVYPLLFSVPTDSVAYAKAIQLTRILRTFLPMPSESIPKDSVLREFIGGGCYKSSK